MSHSERVLVNAKPRIELIIPEIDVDGQAIVRCAQEDAQKKALTQRKETVSMPLYGPIKGRTAQRRQVQ